jgi:hypothetical protein
MPTSNEPTSNEPTSNEPTENRNLKFQSNWMLPIASSVVIAGLSIWLLSTYFFIPRNNEVVTPNIEPDVADTEASLASTIEFPFALTDANNIAIDVVLNGTHPLSLMFHTGNGNVCLTKATTEELTDLKLDQQANVESWGGKSSTRFSTSNVLAIGEHTWDDITVFEDDLSGPGTDGKFGPDLFEGKIIELDFDRQVLLAHESLPEYASEFQRFKCRQDRSSLFIAGELEIGGDIVTNEFMIHSGFGGAVLLDDQFVDQNDLEGLEMISVSELRDSFGNVLKVKKVMLPKLTFGDSSFSNVPIGFFDGAINRQKMSVVGGDVLKRFNIIFGSDRSNVYLKPNGLFQLTFGT